MTLDNILEEIKKAETIVVLSHESPDGDAVSSSLSVMHALAQIGKKVDVVIPEYSKIFGFLPGAENILKNGKEEPYDLAISVDCTDLKRLAGGNEYFETAKRTIEIDHHSVNAMFADLNYVDPVAPACCQVLAALFEYYGIQITPELATCILTGIVTDTGGFQWGGVSAETFEFAAELVRKGAKLKDIQGVEIAILLKEKEGANGYKASLRSHETINVSDVCMMLGGGGHRGAAGCFVSGTLEQAKNKILNAAKQGLKK